MFIGYRVQFSDLMSNDRMRVSLSNDSIRWFAVPRDLYGRVFQNRQSEPSSRASS